MSQGDTSAPDAGLPDTAKPPGTFFERQHDAELDASRAVIDAAQGSPNEYKSEVRWTRGEGFWRTEATEQSRGHAKFKLTRSLVAVVHSHTGTSTDRSTMSVDASRAKAGIPILMTLPATGAVVRIDGRGKFSDLRGGTFVMRPDDVRRK